MKRWFALLATVFTCAVVGVADAQPADTNILKQLDLVGGEETAVSADSPEEYARIKPRAYDPRPVKTRLRFYYDESRPFIRSSASQDPKLGEKLAVLAEIWARNNVKTVEVNGQQSAVYKDCTHFVRAVYWKATGIDLFYESIKTGAAARLNAQTGSGCALLWAYAKDQQRFGKIPRIGDIVFFDNTWDKNGNRRWDDWLTHVGIVTAVSSDGVVTFAHSNTGNPKSIKIAKLNVKNPDDPKTNTYLKVKYSWDERPRQLAGQLVAGFGGFRADGAAPGGDRPPKDDDPGDRKDDRKTDDKRKDDAGTADLPDADAGRLQGKWKLYSEKIGSWKYYIVPEMVFEFRANGTGIFTQFGVTDDGTWKKDGNRITIREKGLPAATFEIRSITAKELMLVSPSDDDPSKMTERVFRRK